jgi:hypothetical protein
MCAVIGRDPGSVESETLGAESDTLSGVSNRSA